jgi:TonB family protein
MQANLRAPGLRIFLLSLLLAGGFAFCQTPQSSDEKMGGVEILSNLPADEMTVFTEKALPTIVSQIKKAWYPLIPPVARPPKLEQGRVGIEFELHSNGKISKMILDLPAGKIALDRAAWGALTGAQPFAPFPPELKTETIRLRFFFLYNMVSVDRPASSSHQEESKTHSPVN